MYRRRRFLHLRRFGFAGTDCRTKLAALHRRSGEARCLDCDFSHASAPKCSLHLSVVLTVHTVSACRIAKLSYEDSRIPAEKEICFLRHLSALFGESVNRDVELLDPPALTGMCPDADDPSVEAAVSNLKAPELMLGRRHAHHGGILAPGGRRWEAARAAVAGETR